MSTRAIRSVCVVGDGIAGLSAAAAFARALPGVRVSIVAAPTDPTALAERMPASLPSIHRFHAAIGLDELELVRSGVATHLLGVRFGDWIHGFGEHGLKAGDIPFHTLWHRARAAGRAEPFHRYSAAAVLGEAGKFTHPSSDSNAPLGGFLYGLRLDPKHYRARLTALTAELSRGDLAAVEQRPNGGIAALLLASGERVEADLYLDCSGPQALLRSLLDQEFEPWDDLLPGHFHVREEPAEPRTPLDQADGHAWRSPLPDRTIVIEAAADGIPVRPGRRPAPWAMNVLAIGEAAIRLDPFYGTGLHLAQSAILLALELLPGRDCHPVELAEYNRRSRELSGRARDFHALHYLRPGQALPASLARTIEQFRRRGRLPLFEAESFDHDSWLAVLLGLGILPEDEDPVAASVDLERVVPAMDALAARLRQAAAGLPPAR